MTQPGQPRAQHTLACEQLGLRYGNRTVLSDVSLAFEPGSITAIVGPNGAGKSTLLRLLARLLAPDSGRVLLDGQELASLRSREIARKLSMLPQGPAAPEGMTVYELVEQGRFPHLGLVRATRDEDRERILEALDLTGLSEHMDRPIEQLSGGERQRAWIALALSQDTPLLLLDEPTTFLDIGHQFETLDLITGLRDRRGLTVLMVLHDLNHASRYADRLIVVAKSRVVADGAPHIVLTRDLLAKVFQVEATVLHDPVDGTLVCVPYRHVNSRIRGSPRS